MYLFKVGQRDEIKQKLAAYGLTSASIDSSIPIEGTVTSD